MFVLCMREVISRFKPFSVGSHRLLVRVVSLSVIFGLMCSDVFRQKLVCTMHFAFWNVVFVCL